MSDPLSPIHQSHSPHKLSLEILPHITSYLSSAILCMFVHLTAAFYITCCFCKLAHYLIFCVTTVVCVPLSYVYDGDTKTIYHLFFCNVYVDYESNVIYMLLESRLGTKDIRIISTDHTIMSVCKRVRQIMC